MDAARYRCTLPLLEEVTTKDKASGTRPGRDEPKPLGAVDRVGRALVGQGLALLAQQSGQLPRAEGCMTLAVSPAQRSEVHSVGERVPGFLRHAPVLALGDSAPRAVMTEADGHWLRLFL